MDLFLSAALYTIAAPQYSLLLNPSRWNRRPFVDEDLAQQRTSCEGEGMSHPTQLFFHAVESRFSSPSAHWVGLQWSGALFPALRSRGWDVSLQESESRLEFFSLPRESRQAIFVEEIPEGWSGELVQRFLAAVFQALCPGGGVFSGVSRS